MQIRPVIAALRSHRVSAFLIALEIALACAVLCNATFLIAQRLDAMRIASGTDEASLAVVRLQGYSDAGQTDLNARITAGLAGIPGVASVSAINAVPFGPRAGTAGITLDAAGERFGGVLDFYVGGPGAFEALGLRVVQGRGPQAGDFQPMDSFVPADSLVQVTRALARHLWPDESPLGKEFWVDKMHFRVVGVIDHLTIPQPGGRGRESVEWSVFVPGQPGPQFMGNYLLRAPPSEMQRVLHQARRVVAETAPDIVLDEEQTRTVPELRDLYFRQDRAMAGLMVGVVLSLLLVTALGIAGLTNFWVAQRHRQIGVRRALGATRGDILRYFQTENFLIVSAGVAIGMLLAFGVNQLMMGRYELPRLPWAYLPIGAAAMWALGQIAILAPARRASSVPPAVATRAA